MCVGASTCARVMLIMRPFPLLCVKWLQPLLVSSVWCDPLPSCACSANPSWCAVYGATPPLFCVKQLQPLLVSSVWCDPLPSCACSANPSWCAVYGATPPLFCVKQLQPLLVSSVWCDPLPSSGCSYFNTCLCDVYGATPSPLVHAAPTRAGVLCMVRPLPSRVCNIYNINKFSKYNTFGLYKSYQNMS